MDAKRRTELLHKYRTGPQAVVDSLANLRDEELDRSQEDDEWTPRQIVHHIADSEMTSAIRLRKLVAEDNPTIEAYDEKVFANSLTRDRPIEPSLQAVRWARESTVQILDRLTDDEWHKAGTHTELGPYSVEKWLEVYAAHCHDHAAQIKRARGIA
ncbi:MAG TPA: DinB family protein [Candidatus Dormibacteraeota bacterium]|nr:DinB family protein [Candidatus Dormibacteraeota bacterium]